MLLSLCEKFILQRISNAFVDNLKLPRERTKVTLVDPNKREWHVWFLRDQPRATLMKEDEFRVAKIMN